MEVEESRVVIATHKKISNGVLEVMDDFILDKASLPEGLNAPFVINADRSTIWLIPMKARSSMGFGLSRLIS